MNICIYLYAPLCISLNRGGGGGPQNQESEVMHWGGGQIRKVQSHHSSKPEMIGKGKRKRLGKRAPKNELIRVDIVRVGTRDPTSQLYFIRPPSPSGGLDSTYTSYNVAIKSSDVCMWIAPSTPITVVHSNFGHIVIISVNADFLDPLCCLARNNIIFVWNLGIRDWCFPDEHEILWIEDIVPILSRNVNMNLILNVFLCCGIDVSLKV